jgi:diguanylate cyclase (GGDEF)-like protein
MKLLVRNYPLLMVVLALLILTLVLSWQVNNREQEFVAHQQEIMERSVSGAAVEVTLLVKQLRRTLSLLADEHREMLWELSIDPDNESVFHHLYEHVLTYLPDHHWLTIANQQGEVLYDDFGEKVGDLCRTDIRKFIDSEHNYQTYIHPGPDDYHFDVMAPWNYQGKGNGVFYVSFKPRIIARLLRHSEVVGHQLILLRSDIPSLIEISSHGGRNELDRPIHLGKEELARISVSKQLKGTRWTLAALPAADLFSQQRAQIRGQAVLVLAGFIILSGIMLWLIRGEEKKRTRAETALRNSHNELETRVAERTKDLLKTNYQLQTEINERIKAQDSLQFQAHHDALTGLPNRMLLRDRLEHAFAQSNRTGMPVAIMLLDLDGFKLVNDSLGHHNGDELLKTVAMRLRNCVRDYDTVSRLAGDEFTVLLEGINNIDDASLVAQNILAVVEEPIFIGGHEVSVTTSIGITVYPADSRNIDELLKNADTAMYRAKKSGNAYMFFTTEMTTHALERLETQNQLRHALERDEFRLHYQPRIDIQTDTASSFEALLRWQHPRRGLVPPCEFIQLLEESGLIIPVGEWALRTACMFNQRRIDAGQQPLRVSVNLSPRQFNDKQLVNRVVQCLEETGMNSKYLELEITESLLIDNIDAAVKVLVSLHARGINISIDDFGTGYSSMSYLKRLPINTLKIDRSFIRDVTDDADDATIVKTIIAMAHSLRLHVTAEGVETREQLQFLKEQGCEEAQGYLFSKPIPADEIESWLDDVDSKTVNFR